jgi:CDP-diacylglycerol--serine O-phosphatidyltransferase
VWALAGNEVHGADAKWLAWCLTVFAGFTMVSNLKYYSGKDINPRKSVSFSSVVLISLAVVALMTVSSTLPEMLFLLFAGYAVSGYVIALWLLIKRKGIGAPPPA